MNSITFEGKRIDVAPGQTVLAAFEAAGVPLEYSCRSGVCQTCVLQAVEGNLPAVSQAGLGTALVTQGFFMPCVCVPETDLIVIRPAQGRQRIEVAVRSIERLSESVVRLRLDPLSSFSYRPGQFLGLIAPTGLIRSYSIASVPERDPYLELHVRIVPNGRMSNLISNHISIGDRLHVHGPYGTCCYEGVKLDREIVLAGTGTGLAPLWGILQDALIRGHKAPIRLYHGALSARGLYLVEELMRVADEHPLFTYTACVLDREKPSDGDLAAAVIRSEHNFSKSEFFLCGDPDTVKRLKRGLFLAGAKLDQLRIDAFIPCPP